MITALLVRSGMMGNYHVPFWRAVKGATPSLTLIHRCLYIGLRSGKSFKCTNGTCLWHGDADCNGSLMIQAVGLSARQPKNSGLFCSLNRDDSGLLKAIGLQSA
jgi:hypothetical protein